MPFNSANARKTIARNLRKQDTWAEQLLWRWLRDRRFSKYKFRRQHPFGPYVLDFFCMEALLNIELDGSQHGFQVQQEKDQVRDAWLTAAGVKVLRFWNSRLRSERESIRDTIWRELQARAPHPLPDYCRPMQTKDKSAAAAPMNAERPSPSPQPSPSGRGGNLRRDLPKLASRFAKPLVALTKAASELARPTIGAANQAAGSARKMTELHKNRPIASPLPEGEGQGEGERGIQTPPCQ